MAAGLSRRDDHWVLPCEGLIVGQVRVDYCFGLFFSETPTGAAEVAWSLRICSPFTLHGGGTARELNPEGPATHLGPALAVRHQQLAEGSLWANGRLRMTFRDSTVIDVRPDSHYEAWILDPNPIEGFPFTLVAPIAPDEVDWS